MDLWIRNTQRTVLTKANCIYIHINKKPKINEIKVFEIYADKVMVGAYITEQRAIEIIDEIQEIIRSSSRLHYVDLKDKRKELDIDSYKIEVLNLNTVIYEMPKE